MTSEIDNLAQQSIESGQASVATATFAGIATRAADSAAAENPVRNNDSESADSDLAPDVRLDQLLHRINQLRVGVVTPPSVPERAGGGDENVFFPVEPASWAQTQLNESEVEILCMKYLLACGSATGMQITDQVKLPFKLLEGMLHQLKSEQLVYYRGTSAMGDYEYQLTDMGRERARRYAEHCAYFGAAPVSLSDYIDSVESASR